MNPMNVWLRTFWREVLIALLLALPLLSLLPLGFAWLWQMHAATLWAGLLLACVVASSLLLWQRPPAKATPGLAADVRGEPVWGSRENAVWTQVQHLADETPALSLTSQDEALAAVTKTITLVAGALHPAAGNPAARFTVPEALLAVERVSRALRADLLKRVPLIHRTRVSDVLWLVEQQRRHGPRIGKIWNFVRVVRMALSPVAAIESEVRGQLWDMLWGKSSAWAQNWMTRAIVLETGRAAINLYGGRFRMNAEEIAQLIADETARLMPTPPPAPIRILLAGQVSVGKSSLVNALAGEMRAPVHPLPTPGGFRVFQLAPAGQPEVTVVDSPGLTAGAALLDALLEEAQHCDLLLWVAAANQPARALDVQALEKLRAAFAIRIDHRPPPIVLAVTHVDQLQPAREWKPPYDIAKPAGAKAQSIRLALEATATALQVALVNAIPVGLPDGAPAYNVDLVWAQITALLPQAQQTQLNRMMADTRGSWDFGKILAQAYHGGRVVLAEVVQSVPDEILATGAERLLDAALNAANKHVGGGPG